MRVLTSILVFMLAASAFAGGVLREDTATTISIGPLVATSDGYTTKTALSPTVRVSANGAAYGLRNSSNTIKHDWAGNYRVGLSDTDTSTAGYLKIQVQVATALPYFETYQVLPTQVYDSLYGTDKLQVHAAEISNDLITADAIAAAAITASEMDLTGSEFSAIPWNAAWDAEAQSEATDALNAYDPPTNAEMIARTLEAEDYATTTALADVPTVAEFNARTLEQEDYATSATVTGVWAAGTRTLSTDVATSASVAAVQADLDDADSGLDALAALLSKILRALGN